MLLRETMFVFRAHPMNAWAPPTALRFTRDITRLYLAPITQRVCIASLSSATGNFTTRLYSPVVRDSVLKLNNYTNTQTLHDHICEQYAETLGPFQNAGSTNSESVPELWGDSPRDRTADLNWFHQLWVVSLRLLKLLVLSLSRACAPPYYVSPW